MVAEKGLTGKSTTVYRLQVLLRPTDSCLAGTQHLCHLVQEIRSLDALLFIDPQDWHSLPS